MILKLDRRSLLLAAIAVALTATPGNAATPRAPHVLLVCQYGSVKSAIARELLKRRSAQRGIALAVQSRGITPELHLPPELKERLAADKLNPEAQPLRRLKSRDVQSADLVIAFDKLPSQFHPRKLIDWTDLPSMVNDYANARAVLDARIDKLLDSLAPIPCGRFPCQTARPRL
jgi:protein-tyrosine-phosphatase